MECQLQDWICFCQNLRASFSVSVARSNARRRLRLIYRWSRKMPKKGSHFPSNNTRNCFGHWGWKQQSRFNIWREVPAWRFRLIAVVNKTKTELKYCASHHTHINFCDQFYAVNPSIILKTEEVFLQNARIRTVLMKQELYAVKRSKVRDFYFCLRQNVE